MLRSVIRQLSAGAETLPEAVTKLADYHRKSGSHPDIDQLLKVLHTVLSTLKKDVFLVLDALDECDEDVKNPRRQDLLDLIKQLVEKGHGNLHLLMTSRREEDILISLKGLTNVPVEIDVEQKILIDLEMFIRTKMARTPALEHLGDQIKAEIEQKVNKGEER